MINKEFWEKIVCNWTQEAAVSNSAVDDSITKENIESFINSMAMEEQSADLDDFLKDLLK